jgi:hypothetical protein
MTPNLAEQRREVRQPCRQAVSYLKSLIKGDTISFEEGLGTILNESLNGALIGIPRSYHAGDIIEVQLRRPGERPPITLFEVCWSQLVRHGFETQGSLIGCRRLFTY